MKDIVKHIKWDIIEENILSKNRIIPNKKALFRNDNQKLLGIHSNKYQVFRNKDLQKLCKEIEKVSPYKLNQFVELNAGKKVLAFLRNKDIQLVNNIAVKEYLVIGNSFDGTSSLFVGYNSHMIRCENQFTDSKRIVQSKHLKGRITKEIDIQYIINIFNYQKKQTLDAFSIMQKTNISEKEIDQLMRLIIGKREFDGPNKKEEKIMESINKEIAFFGKNSWGLFNGITHYTSNIINKGRHTFGNVSGESQRINKIAMDFLIQLN
tara:strand:+ start:5170 stop:5964 length:795 start_codon:yes stop_codon:yes gene_type:complete